MKNLFCLIVIIFGSLFFVQTVSAQCQGNTYITSITWQTGNSVQGFSATELDYCAGVYYDPALSASLTEGYGTGYALIGQGYTQGYADSTPAALNFAYSSPINNLSYTTTGDHFVIAYYQVYVPYWNAYYWYDPWNLVLAKSAADMKPDLIILGISTTLPIGFQVPNMSEALRTQ